MLVGPAVVTGASRGIGRAVALALAAAGCDVVGVARDGEALGAVGTAVERHGRQYLPISADLATAQGALEVVDRAWAWKGGVGILVNAAGILVRKPEQEITVDEFDVTLATNVRAPFLLTRGLGALMYELGAGAIVNVASIAGERVTGAPAPYQVSKAALIQMTRYFAKALAPRVRVNAVGPGYVHTELSRSWLKNPDNERWVIERTPLGRIAKPDDVVGPILFLASSDAGYVTGQHLLVDGGWSIL